MTCKSQLHILRFFLKSVLLILAIGLPCSHSPLLAQPVEKEILTGLRYWIYGGPSLTTLGAGVNTGVTVDNNRHLFSLRGTSTYPLFEEETWEVAFLYGRAVMQKNFYLSAGAGVSVVGGTKYPRLFSTDRAEEFEPMIGFPLEARVYWTPVNIAGVGIHTFANINTGQPLGGIALILRLGYFRR